MQSRETLRITATEFVRISCNPPMKAEVYVKSRLRCNLCGKVYTADLPPEVKSDGNGSQCYGYSARSLMALLKYFSGFPFYRQQSLHGILGVPVTASSVFDQCEFFANDAKSIFNAFTRLAEKADHCRIDDTTNRILDAGPS
ncbi:MAG: transposase [Pseudobacteriovorax sp.]|nr:transposase [Pseudobacteriovorax sp.]